MLLILMPLLTPFHFNGRRLRCRTDIEIEVPGLETGKIYSRAVRLSINSFREDFELRQ